jgi:uncharacterized membrane protein (DUF485 family)
MGETAHGFVRVGSYRQRKLAEVAVKKIKSAAQKDGGQSLHSRRTLKKRGSMAETTKRFEADQSVWDRIAASQEFKDLMATKKVFIIPAFVFFVVYYFALPILVGYAPQFMSTRVIGVVNLAYLFALSQFFMAWTIAWLYVKAAGDFDKLAKDIVEKSVGEQEGK